MSRKTREREINTLWSHAWGIIIKQFEVRILRDHPPRSISLLCHVRVRQWQSSRLWPSVRWACSTLPSRSQGHSALRKWGERGLAILSLASVCLLLASPQELTLLKGLLSVWAEKTPEAGCVMLNVRSQDNDSDWHMDHGPCWLGPLCYPPLAVLLVLTFKDWSVTFHSSLGFWPLWHVKMEDCVTSPRALQQEEQTWGTQFLMTLTNKVGMRKLSAVLRGLSIYKFSSILCKFLFRRTVTLKAPYLGEEFSFKQPFSTWSSWVD